MAETLSSRERVIRMMQRRDHDRVPRHESFWGDTIERWQREGLDGDADTVLGMLGSDFHGVGWGWPSPYSDEQVIEEDDQTVLKRDVHGRIARWWKGRAGTPEHIGFECDSREKWETRFKPMLLARGQLANVDKVRALHAAGRQAGKWVHLTGVEPFEITRALIGDEETAIAMATDPEWIVDIATTYTDGLLAAYQACLDAGLEFDGLWVYGDMAYNHATFCSPRMYKDLIWPQHKRQVDFAHDNGMKFIYHTDGNVNGVIDLWIEAGFDCFQPIEAKAHMDIRELCPKYGDKLAMFGNIDVMVMATNDLAKIEAEIASKFAVGMAVKGYAYHSDHSVPPSVSWNTYQQIIQLVDKYGKYE